MTDDWILIEESMTRVNLPNTLAPVMIAYDHTDWMDRLEPRVTMGFYTERWKTSIQFYPDDSDDNPPNPKYWEYHKEKDDYFMKEGWYDNSTMADHYYRINSPVTHWMPVPVHPSKKAKPNVDA